MSNCCKHCGQSPNDDKFWDKVFELAKEDSERGRTAKQCIEDKMKRLAFLGCMAESRGELIGT
jgi:hypothetical protein